MLVVELLNVLMIQSIKCTCDLSVPLILSVRVIKCMSYLSVIMIRCRSDLSESVIRCLRLSVL